MFSILCTHIRAFFDSKPMLLSRLFYCHLRRSYSTFLILLLIYCFYLDDVAVIYSNFFDLIADLYTRLSRDDHKAAQQYTTTSACASLTKSVSSWDGLSFLLLNGLTRGTLQILQIIILQIRISRLRCIEAGQNFCYPQLNEVIFCLR